MYKKAEILRTIGDLFFKSFDYIANVLTGSDNFEERIDMEWAAKKNPVYIPKRGFNLERELEKYVHFTAYGFHASRKRVEEILKQKKPGFREVKQFLEDYVRNRKEETKKFLKKHEESLKKKSYNQPVLFLPWEPIFHVYYDFLTLIELNREKIDGKTILDHVIELINSLNNQEEEKNEEYVDDFIKRLGISLTPTQKNVLVESLSNTFVAINGVPGSGKTTMLFFYFLAIAELLLQKKKRINIVLTANTYAAIKEFIRKIADFLEKSNFQKFVKGLQLHIYALLKKELCNKKVTNGNSEEPEDLAQLEDFSEIREKLDKLSRKGLLSFDCITQRKDAVKNLPNGVNLIVLPISKFISHFHKGNRIKIEEPIDVLMIDEASQVSGPSILEVLAGISLSEESRIIMVGDKSQLPPIYSVVEEETPLYSIGALYNLYTFFEGKYRLCELSETKRIPREIAEVVEGLYTQIISIKDQKIKVELEEKGLLREILNTRDLSDYSLIRIKVNYPKELLRDRRSNATEVEIIRRLLSEINPEVRVAVMSAFKEQEELLKSRIKRNNCILGTIDKLQGREVPVSIISLVSNHPTYTKEILPFICTPNRLNVAITRAQETVILIHSETFEKEVLVAFDNTGIEKARELIVGYKKFGREVPNLINIFREFPAVNYELGFQIIRRFFRLTNHIKTVHDFPKKGISIEVYACLKRQSLAQT